MKILHSSDLHGDWSFLLEKLRGDNYDLWVDTGDFFDNETRGNAGVELSFQARCLWSSSALGVPAREFASALRGRPVLSVPGNHDYFDLTPALCEAGAVAHEITPAGIEVKGFRFSGFRQIPWIEGEWNGEAHDFSNLIDQTMDSDPDVLCTHAPPSGILSGVWGIPLLTSTLMYTRHEIRTHLFGHVHEFGGMTRTAAAMRFFNGARTVRIIDIGEK